MSSIVKRISSAVFKALEMNAKARVRRELLLRDERTLADLGFSRHLLEQGISAWPWREDEVVSAGAGKLKERDYRKAARELKAYTDDELADLDLPRCNIDHAVRYGRPGIDDTDRQAA